MYIAVCIFNICYLPKLTYLHDIIKGLPDVVVRRRQLPLGFKEVPLKCIYTPGSIVLHQEGKRVGMDLLTAASKRGHHSLARVPPYKATPKPLGGAENEYGVPNVKTLSHVVPYYVLGSLRSP